MSKESKTAWRVWFGKLSCAIVEVRRNTVRVVGEPESGFYCGQVIPLHRVSFSAADAVAVELERQKGLVETLECQLYVQKRSLFETEQLYALVSQQEEYVNG